MKKEVKFGALLSYILIICNSVYGMVIAPYMLSMLGNAEYGVYKTIGSLTASMVVLDLGIGGTMQRYIAKFNAEGKRRECSNFSAMGLLQAAGLSVVMLLVCVVLYFRLDAMYAESFLPAELARAKEVFLLSALSLLLGIFENVINGIISGLNRFVFSNGLKVMTLFLRAGLIAFVLPLWKSAVAVMTISVAITSIVILLELVYLLFCLKMPIRYSYFDKTIFKESAVYTGMMFVQSLTAQINTNLDNVLIGSLIGAVAVSVYSFGLTIFGMFQQLSCAISGVMLPTVTDKLTAGTDNRGLEDLVIQAGRIQFAILGAVICGFAVIGKEFIFLWLGEGFEDVWLISMIFMIPTIWELSQNVCLSILRAKNLLSFRTAVLVVGLVLNFLISYFGTKHYGYFAAAIGTSVSVIVSSLICMNVYYYKKLRLNVFRIFYRILHFNVVPLAVGTTALIGFDWLVGQGGFLLFAGKVAVFVIFFGLTLLLTQGRRMLSPLKKIK